MGEIKAGIDIEKLEGFREAIQKDPVTLGLKARSVWEGHTGRSTVHIGEYSLGGQKIDRDTRKYTISYGAWKEVEEAMGAVGPTDRMEPVEMALGALSACLSYSIGLNAARHGIDLEEMEITTTADVDPSVLFELKGPEAHGSCMPTINCEVKVKGKNLTPEQLQTIERLVAYSPVHGMIAQMNNIQTKVVSG